MPATSQLNHFALEMATSSCKLLLGLSPQLVVIGSTSADIGLRLAQSRDRGYEAIDRALRRALGEPH
jgi:hypothetical protein